MVLLLVQAIGILMEIQLINMVSDTYLRIQMVTEQQKTWFPWQKKKMKVIMQDGRLQMSLSKITINMNILIHVA